MKGTGNVVVKAVGVTKLAAAGRGGVNQVARQDPCVESYRGRFRTLYITVDLDAVDEDGLRDRCAVPQIQHRPEGMQIWQATAGGLDRYIKRLVSLGLRRKAKQHKIIGRAMMGIAVRHGALMKVTGWTGWMITGCSVPEVPRAARTRPQQSGSDPDRERSGSGRRGSVRRPRGTPLKRMRFDGDPDAIAAMRAMFHLEPSSQHT